MRMRFLAAALLALAGCANYTWTSGVPERMRTVSVPVMRNESNVTELGAVMSRQLLREFQREGTFAVRRVGDSAIEVQGTVKSLSPAGVGYDRRSGLRIIGYDLVATVEISVIDKTSGRVLVDNRRYMARASVAFSQDAMTAERDASGRLADDLSRQVVDDVLNLKW